jgi:hypothetical protein
MHTNSNSHVHPIFAGILNNISGATARRAATPVITAALCNEASEQYTDAEFSASLRGL